jgi:signal transduction histidine kinase
MTQRELVGAGTFGAATLYASARARIVSATALGLLLIAGIAYVPSVLAAISAGQTWVIVLDTVLVGWIAILTALRRRYPRAVAGQLLAFFYLTGVAFLVPFGPASAGLLFLFVVPVFAAVALGMRASIAALVVNTVTLAAVGALLEAGALVWPYLEPRALWWMISGSFVLLDLVSAISIAVLLGRLRQSLAENVELATALEETAELVAITNERLELVWANRAFKRAVGETSARDVRELLGMLPSTDAERLAKSVAANETFTGRLACEKRDGATLLLDVTSTVLPGPRPARVFVARDVTHESLLRAELAQAQRLEAIGTLAGGIAHDLNNMMSPVLANAEALREAQSGKEGRELASEIVQAASRARELLRRVLRATAPSGDRSCSDLASVVRDEMRLVAATMPPNVRVSLTVPDVELPVGLSEVEIERVLVNLCVNAAQAMPRGGTLEVSVRRAADESPLAVLEVTDTGTGMSDSTKARVFDPFFTTKELGQGTGLGLTGVHQLVRKIDGSIEVESELGRGTTFRIALPIVEARASRPISGEPKPAAWQGRRALLVDDDASVRRALGRSLSRLGIEVDSEADGHTAIRRFREDPKRWDLVITDLTMPETTGLDVLEQIRAMSTIPVLVVTGRVDPEVDRRASELGVTALLLKPIATAELRDVLNRCL